MKEQPFKLCSEYAPSGDQPQAIEKLIDGVRKGMHYQSLLGVTGSGKTFTMANVIAAVNKPTLVLAHNKTLAGQLCSEFRDLALKNVEREEAEKQQSISDSKRKKRKKKRRKSDNK